MYVPSNYTPTRDGLRAAIIMRTRAEAERAERAVNADELRRNADMEACALIDDLIETVEDNGGTMTPTEAAELLLCAERYDTASIGSPERAEAVTFYQRRTGSNGDTVELSSLKLERMMRAITAAVDTCTDFTTYQR